MAIYRMSDGTVVNTENASESWKEATRWNGSNHISVPTGDQFLHQTLHRSRKGRYYIEHEADWQGSTPRAEWVSNEEATRWLVLNECTLPDELKPLEEAVSE